jgi:tRNA pseudouridine38-40 synthase
LRNVLLTIEYDGSGFHGWQRQPGKLTVQGELERVLTYIFGGIKTEVNGASRTDAGVHAYGQSATISVPTNIPAERIPLAVNPLLEGIRITKAEEKPEGFHARFDAKGKTYIYRIVSAPEPDIFMRSYCYYVPNRPDAEAMKEAAKSLTGTHDFSSFCTAGGNGSSGSGEGDDRVRTIDDIIITQKEVADTKGGAAILTELSVTGGGFLYNMVRIIAGTLVEAGDGRISPCEMDGILGKKDRQDAGHTAPPGGLWLKRVYYG